MHVNYKLINMKDEQGQKDAFHIMQQLKTILDPLPPTSWEIHHNSLDVDGNNAVVRITLSDTSISLPDRQAAINSIKGIMTAWVHVDKELTDEEMPSVVRNRKSTII